MELALIEMLENLLPVMKTGFMWLGLLVVTLRGVVKITPTGKDDALVAKIDKIPFVGGFLSGVASRAPK